MQTIDLWAFGSFVIATTFTPGPNNITCASLGSLFGFRKALPFMAGVNAGFFLVLLASTGISSLLFSAIPSLETILRWVGAAYILWLAFQMLRATYSYDEANQNPVGLIKGVTLQFLNVKGVIYALTLFATFLAPFRCEPFVLAGFFVFLCAMVFISNVLWALFGASVRRYCGNTAVRRGINTLFCLLLVWTAASVALS